MLLWRLKTSFRARKNDLMHCISHTWFWIKRQMIACDWIILIRMDAQHDDGKAIYIYGYRLLWRVLTLCILESKRKVAFQYNIFVLTAVISPERCHLSNISRKTLDLWCNVQPTSIHRPTSVSVAFPWLDLAINDLSPPGSSGTLFYNNWHLTSHHTKGANWTGLLLNFFQLSEGPRSPLLSASRRRKFFFSLFRFST